MPGIVRWHSVPCSADLWGLHTHLPDLPDLLFFSLLPLDSPLLDSTITHFLAEALEGPLCLKLLDPGPVQITLNQQDSVSH